MEKSKSRNNSKNKKSIKLKADCGYLEAVDERELTPEKIIAKLTEEEAKYLLLQEVNLSKEAHLHQRIITQLSEQHRVLMKKLGG